MEETRFACRGCCSAFDAVCPDITPPNLMPELPVFPMPCPTPSQSGQQSVPTPLPEPPVTMPELPNPCDLSANPLNSIFAEQVPLAMAYAPLQVICKVYEPDVGLSRGTIFPCLDKPFLGEEALPRG